MDNAGSGTPESDAVFLRHAAKEVVNLFVGDAGSRQIGLHSDISLYQVVAVNRRRHGHAVLSCVHKLQQSHLRRCVLHGHAVGSEVHIVFSALVAFQLAVVVKVSIEHLLGKRQRPVKHLCSVHYLLPVRGIKLL